MEKIEVGSVLLGPMEGVNHKKFYIIAGISTDKLCICSVIINSEINQFIKKRPWLLECQVKITSQNNSFLDYDSFVNCAQPMLGVASKLKEKDFKFVDVLHPDDLDNIISTIIDSGSLSEDEIADFFNE